MSKEIWEDHWKKLENPSWFSHLARVFRAGWRARAVRDAFVNYFPEQGTFVETGSGTSQTSALIPRQGKTLIAVDYAKTPLTQARRFMDKCVVADIRKLPFRKNSIDGIRNLGVMEHYREEEQVHLLKEFHRVLRPKARIVLFWPPPYGFDKMIFETISACAKVFGRRIEFFPDEPGRVMKRQAKHILERAGFQVVDIYLPLWDVCTELVVVGEKP